jgi:hypothetical protein
MRISKTARRIAKEVSKLPGLGNDKRLSISKTTRRAAEVCLNYQVGRDEHARLSESLMDSLKSSIRQGVLMKMGSVDLMVCQRKQRKHPILPSGQG